MSQNMDWQAAMSSEIFREFAKNEIKKIAEDESDAFSQFEAFQEEIKSSPAKKEAFLKLQKEFIRNPEGQDPLFDPSFVEAVLLLDLE